MKKLLYAGSFDPVTRGHLEIIERAAALCDTLYVAVMVNPEKRGAIERGERVRLLEMACRHLANVRIIEHSGLLVDCARDLEADAVIRGLRGVADYEQEAQMAATNRLLGGVETLMLASRGEYAAVSSSMVRQIAAFSGDISAFVPEGMADEISAALARGY